jgi:hypothetical protein
MPWGDARRRVAAPPAQARSRPGRAAGRRCAVPAPPRPGRRRRERASGAAGGPERRMPSAGLRRGVPASARPWRCGVSDRERRVHPPGRRARATPACKTIALRWIPQRVLDTLGDARAAPVLRPVIANVRGAELTHGRPGAADPGTAGDASDRGCGLPAAGRSAASDSQAHAADALRVAPRRLAPPIPGRAIPIQGIRPLTASPDRSDIRRLGEKG